MFKSMVSATKRKCSTIVVLFITGLILLLVLSVSFNSKEAVHILRIQDENPIFVTDPNFLSIALDASVIADGFRTFHARSDKLRKLMQNLSPGYLRIGGTMADRLVFVSNDYLSIKYMSAQDGDVCGYEDEICDIHLRPNFTMSGNEWIVLNNIAKESGFVILFNLNSLMRNPDGSWNSENAEELINFSNRNHLNVIWELGNEPDLYKHVFRCEINATQLAADYLTLRRILDKYPRYRNCLLVGPGISKPRPENKNSAVYLKEFYKYAGHLVNAVTWHQYYFNGRTASYENYMDPDIFDFLAMEANVIQNIVGAYNIKSKPVWLGQTGAAFGGGSPGYESRYLGTFIWLDKLGVAAKSGIHVVIRHSIFKGLYGLLTNKYEPTPDYWISVLYKILVGPEVIPCLTAASNRVRLYCQCTSKHYLDSAITVYGVNMKGSNAVIRIQGLTDSLNIDVIYAYVLTPRISLFSKNVYLNRDLLVLEANGELPAIKPTVIKGESQVVIPAYSTAFFVIPSKIQACRNKRY